MSHARGSAHGKNVLISPDGKIYGNNLTKQQLENKIKEQKEKKKGKK